MIAKRQVSSRSDIFHNISGIRNYAVPAPIVKGDGMYSQACIKRSPLGQRKNGLIRQMTS